MRRADLLIACRLVSLGESSDVFRDGLESLINTHSMENGSDTPDFLLADYLHDCLTTWDKAVTARERWYGRGRAAASAPAESVADELIANHGAHIAHGGPVKITGAWRFDRSRTRELGNGKSFFDIAEPVHHLIGKQESIADALILQRLREGTRVVG